MTYVDVDGNAGVGASTFNSSTSQLNLPAGATVLFAGLYWAGDTTGSGSNAPPNAALRNQVAFRAPGAGGYTTLTATTLDDSTQAGRYQAFRDVTSLVAAAGNGTYTVGNVQAGEGTDHYAGWSLVDRLPRPGRAGAEPDRLRRSAHGQRHHRSDDSGERLPHAALGTRADEGRLRSPTKAISGSPATARTSTERRSRTPRTRRTTSSTPRSRIPERGSARRTRTTRTSSATTPTSSTPTASSPTTRPRRTSA